LREFGIDDYRDTVWREGSAGPLGTIIPGSGIGVVRWLDGIDEVEEIFFQEANRAIHGRSYMNTTWQPDTYTIDGTERIVLQGASISAATVSNANGSTVLLTYVGDSGFVMAQTRQTANATNFGAFSMPIKVGQGDGQQTKLAAVGSLGLPTVFFGVGTKITEGSSGDPAASNWTLRDIPS
jgi:hypothetical protein